VRVFYRARQFWWALTSAPDAESLVEARQALTGPELALFQNLQLHEQAHSLWIYRRLREQKQTDPDLLAAALIHDVGKSRYPLHIWERVLVVLGKACFPNRAQLWSQGQPRGWKRPFVVAQQHPAWGAEMAVEAGASPLTVALIQRHHEALEEVGSGTCQATQPAKAASVDRLLRVLQLVDNDR